MRTQIGMKLSKIWYQMDLVNLLKIIFSHVGTIFETACMTNSDISFETHEDCCIDGNHHGNLHCGQEVGK